MKKICTILILFLLLSCKKEIKHNRKVNRYVPEFVKYKFANYEEYYLYWFTKDNRGNMTGASIAFHETSIQYLYSNESDYVYNYHNLTENKFDLVWASRTRKKLELIESSHGITKYPKNGDIFATYTLINDSVMSVKYRFPDWIKKVNQLAKDSIYPKYLYRKFS
jgi:hypothetical protein